VNAAIAGIENQSDPVYNMVLVVPKSVRRVLDTYLFRIVSLFFQRRWYRHLFTVFTALYWVCYDECKHAYISHIYKYDKYGVVINYAAISLFSLFDSILKWGRACYNTTDFRNPDRKVQTMLRGSQIMITCSLTRIILFNQIFKNHTSELQLHKNIHLLHVGLLGSVSVAWFFLRTCLFSEADLYFYLPVKLLKMACLGAMFQKLGWDSEKYTTPNIYVNFGTMFLEALLIEQTID